MVKKLKFVNIMCPSTDLQRVKDTYIKKYEIQIEDAVKEIGSTNKGLTTCYVGNSLAEYLKTAENLAKTVGVSDSDAISEVTLNESLKTLDYCTQKINDYDLNLQRLLKEKNDLEKSLKSLIPFVSLNISLDKLFNFNFIKYRFGKVPVSSYQQFKTFLYQSPHVLYQKSYSDNEYIWGIYFVPRTLHEKVDAIFSSLYFERVSLQQDLSGNPKEAYDHLCEKLEETKKEIDKISDEKLETLQGEKGSIAAALKKIREEFNFNEMQKYIGKTKDNFYIIVGWMTEDDAKKFEEDAKHDENVVLIIKDDSSSIKSKPPTKLSNLAIFKPFEFFVSMYGLPSYNEIDPTPFLGITYTILFGIMFGDLGQGLLLSVFGFLLYKIKQSSLGAILSVVCLSSAFFGVLFGSVFGYENLIPALLTRPLEDMNSILVATVAFGIILNLCAIFIQILNAIKNKDYENLFFSSNGLTGLFFYITAITLFVSYIFKKMFLPVWAIEILVSIPILIIMFKEPLGNFIKGKKKLIEVSFGEYMMEAVFETFEILLSYVTNTISFVRVGAFALCHAGMMGVVLMLAGASHDSPGNILVMIVGNIFVMCLEGLIVGIQVLRLQYYEMFSRFFKGDGKAFKAFNANSNLKK